jgi:hypothetical protein
MLCSMDWDLSLSLVFLLWADMYLSLGKQDHNVLVSQLVETTGTRSGSQCLS